MRNFQEFLNWEDASDKTIKVKLAYVDMVGDLVAGVVLSQIVYWHLPSKKSGAAKMKVEHDGKLWIAKARADWWGECRVNARQMDRVVSILKEKGLIEIGNWKFNGVPMLHVRIVEDKFLELWEEVVASYVTDSASGFYESVKSKSPNGEATSRIGEVDFTQPVKSYSTENTTENTSYNTNTNRPVVAVAEDLKILSAPTQSKPTAQPSGGESPQTLEAIQRLDAFGIANGTARNLINLGGADLCLAWLHHVQKTNETAVKKLGTGFVIRKVELGETPPGYVTPEHRAAHQEVRERAIREEQAQKQQAVAMTASETARLDEEWEGMDFDLREEIEVETRDRLGVLNREGKNSAAYAAMRRIVQREAMQSR